MLTGLAGQPFGNSGEDSLTLSYAHTFETFGKRGKRVTVGEKEMALAQAELDERRRAVSFEVNTIADASRNNGSWRLSIFYWASIETIYD